MSLTLWLLLLFPLGVLIGFGWGYGWANARASDEIGEQRQKIKGLNDDLLSLEGEILALTGVLPSHDDAGRVLELVARGDPDA